MKKSFIKVLSIVLVVVLTLTSAPLSGLVGLELPKWLDFSIMSSAATSGTCGDKLTWDFDDSTGTLTISGTGEMTSRPWNSWSGFSIRENIRNVVIENGVTSIKNYAFQYCDNISNLTIGNAVTTIGDAAFEGCNSLIHVTIPDNVTLIDTYAFYNCNSLKSVTVGKGVITIGRAAFADCNSLASITVDINNKYYLNDKYGVLFNKDKTTLVQYPIGNTRTSYTIPNSVTTIGDYAFRRCDNLTSVTIPDSVTTLDSVVFANCTSLVSVTIPDSITSIGISAFYNCNSLTDVYYSGLEAQWKKISINSSNEPLLNAKIHYNNCSGYCNSVILPTCTTQGYTTYVCECGYSYEKDYVDALGHTDGEIVEENYVAPTCTETGSKDNVTYCTVCDAETSRKEIIIDATGHTEEEIPAVAPTCTENGLTAGVKCSVCGEIITSQQEIPANGHKYESVVTAPTCTEQGYTTYTCACGDSYVDDYTDPLGHDFENGTCTECNATDPDYFTFSIQEPSRKQIRCNDGIVIHANIEGTLPQGARIEWTSSNSNFSINKSDSGKEITIISKNNGYTTFTATIYNVDNNVIAEDTIEMYSKASFFDKLGGFFRSLFGSTKIYEN